MFGHLSASLQGLVTIRSFDADEILINEFDRHQDLSSSSWFMSTATSCAFGYYLDIVCLIYLGIVTASFFMIGDGVNGGTAGLAITQTISLTSLFQWGLRRRAEVQSQMTSVERILEYR